MSDRLHYSGASSSSTNFFPYALGATVNGGTFIGTYVAAAAEDSYKYLDPLYKLVAQNAILNQGGRADEVRCHPGTREEVIAKIEAWRDGGYLLDRLIFRLSGPAGAGKSAIVQTVAERCIKDGVPMINFFFFRADSTRNHARPLIPTLVFQLFKNFPSLKARVAMIIREDPVIFDASLATQLRTLIIDPILDLQRGSPLPKPILLLIDGLDECDSKADQSALLRILHELVNLPDSPFIALVSSRTESQIVMTFNSLEVFHDSIFLDDSYRPEEDIRLYVQDELAQIRRTHPLGNMLGTEWPSEDHIDAIVRKSSGQFVYAATLVRFVSNPSKSPNASLQTVLGIRPPGKRTPFAEIDALYMHIVSQVDDWDLIRVAITLNDPFWESDERTIEFLGYNMEDMQSSLLDLAPILHADETELSIGRFILHFYHASFNDFLHDRTRAGDFFLDEEAFTMQMIQRIIGNVRNTCIEESQWNTVEYVISHLIISLPHIITSPTANLNASLTYIESKFTSSAAVEDRGERSIIRCWMDWYQKGMSLPEQDLHWDVIPLGMPLQTVDLYALGTHSMRDPKPAKTEVTPPLLGATSTTVIIDSLKFEVQFWTTDR